MKKGYKLIVLLSIMVFIVGCTKMEPKEDDGLVSLQEYNQLESSMPFDEVIELLGAPAPEEGEEQVSKEEVAYTEDETYIWEGVAPDSFIGLTFKNRMLSHKMQKGLE
ncbi:hypothetical protein VBD025_02995 [Virgibacillus flavescens]|uniref:hypothetical protein n=1 Tax=Virgibacillus flavescens TaxID=1611422 RepID=UPI003D341A28